MHGNAFAVADDCDAGAAVKGTLWKVTGREHFAALVAEPFNLGGHGESPLAVYRVLAGNALTTVPQI